MHLIVRVATLATTFFAAAAFGQQNFPNEEVDLDFLVKQNTAAAQQLIVNLTSVSLSLSKHARQKQLTADIADAISNTNIYIALTGSQQNLSEKSLQQAFAYLGAIQGDLNDATAIVQKHQPYDTDPILGSALNQAMLALDVVHNAAQSLLRSALPQIRVDSCGFSAAVEIERVPVEVGGGALIFPDDFPAGASIVTALGTTPEGGTLYVRAGDYVVNGPAGGPVSPGNLGRVHIRGEGATRTRLQGFMVFGGGASLADLAVVNDGDWADVSTLTVRGAPPAGFASFRMTRTFVFGGQNGLTVGLGPPGPRPLDDPVEITCARLGGFILNGIIMGHDFGNTRASGSHFRNVGVAGVGGIGIEIRGDDAVLENVSLSDMPNAAVIVEGDRTTIIGGFLSRNQVDVSISGQATVIQDTYFVESGVNAVRVEGDATRIERNRVLSPVSTGVSLLGHDVVVRDNIFTGPSAGAIVAVIIDAPSPGYHVTGNAISHFTVGISRGDVGGETSGNTFFDVEFPEFP